MDCSELKPSVKILVGDVLDRIRELPELPEEFLKEGEKN